jgi:hypothetical protein
MATYPLMAFTLSLHGVPAVAALRQLALKAVDYAFASDVEKDMLRARICSAAV